MVIMEEERNLLDYVYVLLKWRRMIILAVLAVSLVTAGISLILPKAWTARTVIMPPKEEFDQFGLSAMRASGVPTSLAGLVGSSTPADHLKSMLETNWLRGVIVDRFNLVDEYKAPHRERAIEIFGENTQIELEREGALVVEVTASTPELAAELANALIAELDAFNRKLKSQQARMMREFLEARLVLRYGEFEKSGRLLQRFKEEKGLVNMGAQIEAMVDVSKTIVEELALVEVKLGVMGHLVKGEHETRRQLELEAEELRKQLQAMAGDMGTLDTTLFLGPPLNAMPELGFENALLVMDFRLKEEIIRFLGTKLEEAKYKEALNTPTLWILDPATPPRTRSAPRRALMVLLATGLSLVASTVLAFVFDFWGRVGAQNQEKIQSIKQLFRPHS